MSYCWYRYYWTKVVFRLYSNGSYLANEGQSIKALNHALPSFQTLDLSMPERSDSSPASLETEGRQ